ncbi:pyrokinin-1 receptor isoform X3 [Agrilus planipennis]|nr:pyrokinin-1 receptor isoform X3 [Agrilus planipennis]
MSDDVFVNASFDAVNATVLLAFIHENANKTSSKTGEDALHSIKIILPVTIIFITIFFTGLVGNICTCIVIARNKSMHTATNYYLFNLAISDLLLLICGLPQETYTLWYPDDYVFGEAFCVLQGYAAETSANATVLTITAFTVERYLAICHPFLSYTMSKLSRVVKYVVLVWVFALCLAAPQAFQFGIKHQVNVDGSERSICTVTGGKYAQHAFEISSFLFFVGPMTVITVLYILIAVRLHKSKILARSSGIQRNSARVERGNDSRSKGTAAQRRVIKMLVAVVAAFFICWAPFHSQRLLAMYMQTAPAETQRSFVEFYIALNYISGVLYYFSTTINPILYHIMSRKFREAFKATLVQICKKGSRSKRSDFYLSLVKYQKSFRADRPTDCTEVQDFRSSGHCNDTKILPRNESNISTLPRESRFDSSEPSNVPPTPQSALIPNGSFNLRRKPRHVPHDLKRYGYRTNYPTDFNTDRLKYRLFHIFHNKAVYFNRQGSIESTTSATNTISNSSLQDVDDSEFTSSDLVRYMEQINSDLA